MRQQICVMVDNDADVQQMTNENKEPMSEMLSSHDLNHKVQCIVCRATDGTGTICGFMIYFISHRAYFVGNPDMQPMHRDYRNKGIAQAMLHYFQQDCRDYGILTLLLGV